VPALIRKSDDRALEDALVENIGREDLNPVEEATALERALEQGKLSQSGRGLLTKGLETGVSGSAAATRETTS